MWRENPLVWIRRIIQDRWSFYKRLFVVFLVVVWIVPTIAALLGEVVGFDFSIAYSLWFILLYLWILERRNSEIHGNLEHRVTEDSLAKILDNYFERERDNHEVVLILYSGFHEDGMVDSIFRNFEKITIYLQDPSVAIRTWRGTRAEPDILAFLTSLYGAAQKHKEVSLNVYLYRHRATYKAMAIDDKLLVTSWYTYQSQSNFPNEDESASTDSGEEVIRGSYYPFIRFAAPSNDYIVAKEMFNDFVSYLSHDSKPLSRSEIRIYVEKALHSLSFPEHSQADDDDGEDTSFNKSDRAIAYRILSIGG